MCGNYGFLCKVLCTFLSKSPWRNRERETEFSLIFLSLIGKPTYRAHIPVGDLSEADERVRAKVLSAGQIRVRSIPVACVVPSIRGA